MVIRAVRIVSADNRDSVHKILIFDRRTKNLVDILDLRNTPIGRRSERLLCLGYLSQIIGVCDRGRNY